MNVFIIKTNHYLTAHRTGLAISLLCLNLVLFVSSPFVVTKWIGSIETKNTNWTTFTEQRDNKLNTIITTTSWDGNDIEEIIVHHDVTFKRIGINEVIAYRAGNHRKLYRHRAYKIDDKCVLSFHNSEKMRMDRATLRCLN